MVAEERPRQARESLFLALAGSPAAAAVSPRSRRSAATPPRPTTFARARASAHLSWQNRGDAWQSAGIGEPEPSWCPRQTNRRLDLATTTIDEQLADVRRRIDRLHALAQAGARRAIAADSTSPGRARRGGDSRTGRGAARSRRGRREDRAAEDEARRRRALARRRRLRRLGDVCRRRRGRASQLGHLPRAGAGERRGERVEDARASRGGDPRDPHPTGSRSTTSSRRRATASTTPGRNRGAASLRLATSSNTRPTNCRRNSTERSRT